MGLPKKVEIKCGIKKGANGAFVLCKDGITPRCVESLDEAGECPYKITVWTIREGKKGGRKGI
jgi:hypothetical protein